MTVSKLVHQVYFDNGVDVVPVSPTDELPVTGDWLTNAQYVAAIPTEYPLPAAQVSTLTPQTNALTDAQLRASAVPVNTGLTQPTTPADTQPMSAVSLPLPTGASTAAKQLPDNHQVKVSNTPLDISMGLVAGIVTRSITGYVDAGIDIADTDIWAGADGGGLNQNIWVRPTAARVHTIASTSLLDTAAGVGARTIAVTGLTSWTASGETTEIITMNGVTPVNTVNSYVIVNDMTVVTCGASGPNVGRIYATAVVDLTVSANMRAGAGRTTLAIYGFPSTKKVAFERWNGFINKAGGSNEFIQFSALVDLAPTAANSCWINADTRTVISNGSSDSHWPIFPAPMVNGPSIIKIQATSSKNAASGGASFGFYLVDA